MEKINECRNSMNETLVAVRKKYTQTTCSASYFGIRKYTQNHSKQLNHSQHPIENKKE